MIASSQKLAILIQNLLKFKDTSGIWKYLLT